MHSLMEGTPIKISTSSNNSLNLIIKTANESKTKYYYPHQIQGFTYGGFTSRFWVMKNYINNLESSEITLDSMICWKMISIQIKGFTKLVNLVIHEEEHMDILIQYL